MSAAEIARTWRVMESLRVSGSFPPPPVSPAKGKVKPGHWYPGWIPITDNEGDGYYVDLDPGAAGRPGQVLYFYHDGSRATRVVAREYGEWLASLPARILDEVEQERKLASMQPAPPRKGTAKDRRRTDHLAGEMELFLFFIRQQGPDSVPRARVLRYRPVARVKSDDVLSFAESAGFVVDRDGLVDLSPKGREYLNAAGYGE